MSAEEAVAATRACLSTLDAIVHGLRDQYGDTLGMRRLSSDVDRLKADLDELGDPEPGHPQRAEGAATIEVSDEPYDETMWQARDFESQGPV